MGYTVFKIGSCSFNVSKKMDQEGESPGAEFYPCVGEQQNWRRLVRWKRSSKEFQPSPGFPLTEEFIAGSDSSFSINHQRSGSPLTAPAYMCLFFCPL